jgi:phage shock protein PspC (stress-responsive transcriptional regulator)
MNERKVLGVCVWLAAKFGLNLCGLRILFVAAAFFGFSSPIFIYLINYILKPSSS